MLQVEQRGTLFVVATPIGHLGDLSARAREVLGEADLLVCEDTRRTGVLCTRFGLTARRVSLHAYNESRRTPELIERLLAGERIALVSDAGTPLLSDPGAELVRAAIERDIDVVPIPGPSAILAALVVSGLPTRPFSFIGFLPRKGSSRQRWLEHIATLPGSVVLFEAPTRVARTLSDLASALGPRRVAIACELTKRFEHVTRGRLGDVELPDLRGEVTLVVEGLPLEDSLAAGADRLDDAGIDAWIEGRLAEGAGSKEIARELALRTDLSAREAYRRVLEAR